MVGRARPFAVSERQAAADVAARLRQRRLRVRYPSRDRCFGVVVSATVGPALDSASVTECGVDGGVLFQPIDGDSDGVIVNDQLVSSRDVWSMRLLDGAWKRVSYRNLVT